MTQLDVDSQEFAEAPKALRDAYKKLQKELTDERTRAQGLASQAVGSVLAGKGYKNPKRVEKDLLADGIDPADSAAVESWLSENGDDYARGSAAPESNPDPERQQQAAAHQAIQSVANDSTAADAMTRFERAQAEITPDMDGTQVDAIYRKHGV